MASAFQCDRCGELYKNKLLVSNYIGEYRNLIHRYYDLCPKCYSSFTQWLNKYKQKEDAE